MSARADLPPDLHALVEAVVKDARLRPRERAQVRAELEDHFLEALASKRDVASAARAFGDPSLAAMLIGRAQRRNRSAAERLLRASVIATACLTAALALPYGYSAWRLGAAPATAEAPAIEAMLDGRPIAPERDVVATALAQALDRVYPPNDDGHPTREGLRTIRRIKSGTPTWRADLFEPAWFLFTADRGEAEAAATAVLAAGWDDAGRPDPESLRDELARNPEVRRAFPVWVVMSRVLSAMEGR